MNLTQIKKQITGESDNRWKLTDESDTSRNQWGIIYIRKVKARKNLTMEWDIMEDLVVEINEE